MPLPMGAGTRRMTCHLSCVRRSSVAVVAFFLQGLSACASHLNGEADDVEPAPGYDATPADATLPDVTPTGSTDGASTTPDAPPGPRPDAPGAPLDAGRPAPTLNPVMGWNHWYAFRCGISQSVVLAQASALISTGLAASGYTMLALDDCWMSSTRTSSGSLTWDPAKFPNGIPWLADQLHAMGLQLGIYEAAGTTTCQRLPGSLRHYQDDADTFAGLGIDLVKLDYCGFPASTTLATLTADFKAFGAAVHAANPAMLFSEELPICCATGSASFDQVVSESSTFANMWRVAPDEKGHEQRSFDHPGRISMQTCTCMPTPGRVTGTTWTWSSPGTELSAGRWRKRRASSRGGRWKPAHCSSAPT